MKPILINNLEFAQKQLHISGEISINSCERFIETYMVSHENSTNIRYTLSGFADKLHLPSIHLVIQAALPVQCQRCLELMQIPLNLSFEYLISATDPEDDGESDWLEPEAHMNLTELIEDELLAAMPIAPVHSHACTQASMQSGEKANPFAVLKGKF